MNFLTKLNFLLLAVLVAVLLPQLAEAQVNGSEDSVLKQTISGTEITIAYSRPSVRGRDPLFGGLEKWDHVWTPGANVATTFKFSKDVKLNGTDVAAGKYSVWFLLVEAGPWKMMLHADTTKFHLPAPPMSEAILTIDIQAEEKNDFTETLQWNMEDIRANGGKLEFRWGNTLVPIALAVDPGYKFTFESAEVAPLEGIWLKDRSMSHPADSTVARYKKESPEDAKMIDEWVASYDKKETLQLLHDAQSGMFLIVNKSADEEQNSDGFNKWSEALIQKASGIFASGTLLNGELAFASDRSFWEFEFDEVGVAQVIVERDAQTDQIQSQSTRIKD